MERNKAGVGVGSTEYGGRGCHCRWIRSLGKASLGRQHVNKDLKETDGRNFQAEGTENAEALTWDHN